MKKQLTFIFLLIIQFSYSQPSQLDFVNSRLRQLEVIAESLVKNPKNYELIWERTELIFKPHFSIYSRPSKEIENDSTLITEAFYEHSALKFKGIDVLDELNKLINNADKLTVAVHNSLSNDFEYYVNSSNFFYKRGQYYYLKNNPSKAIEDYLTALNSNPDEITKKDICVAISAYYFNLGLDSEPTTAKTQTQSNLVKSLEYIDMISPQFDKEVQDLSAKQYLHHDYDFEQEKLHLLELTNNKIRLANFHINKTYSLFNLYNKLVEDSLVDNTKNSDTINEILKLAIESLSKAEKYLAPRKINFRLISK
jgi:tetratricopeptide (TPR) repeat protein